MYKRQARCTNCEHIGIYEGKKNQTATCAECGGVFEMGRVNSVAAWGWKVTRDYLDPKGTEYSRHGKEYRTYCGGKHKYRMKDDDGTVYFMIEADTPPDSDLEARLFAPLDWAMAYAGCTTIEYKTAEGWEYL